MKTYLIEYLSGSKTCKGFIAFDPAIDGLKPAIMVAHAWRGQDEFARDKAIALAKLGYIGFAIDVYGDGIESTSDDEAAKLMMPFFTDRFLLRERVVSAFQALLEIPNVDKKRIGAIGFCFGGMTVIELLRSGVDVRGAVSFHGIFCDEMNHHKANLTPISKNIKGSLLAIHGNDDPLSSDDDLKKFRKEMTENHVDWQLLIYGNTSHAFTNKNANSKESGMLYNQLAEKRSWIAMSQFFKEIFER